MNGKNIKIISNSIYCNAPNWLNISNNKEYIILSKSTTKQEIDLFLFSLFVYNNISFTDNPKKSFQNLINGFDKEEVVLGGGLMFCNNDVEILPSCCCGLEQWQEVIADISHRKTVWLGHDPFPTIEYKDNSIIVWSDDCLGIFGSAKSKSDLQSIEFTNGEVISSLAQLEIDVSEFITIPLYGRVKEIGSHVSEALMAALMKWFGTSE
ncbi:hypothetical protein [Breznakiella homolactica]|uniref:Uncharacterized protein n=1 Tax=Breznakiella homolactica TaxID=2798577 RepID=A0A7T7XQD7_9SPIR|nr:hypothetical protein [Breznakiella homolactica]QQO10571.1 hypothetical protein JFL75_06560 [Breznakiella homolactica]